MIKRSVYYLLSSLLLLTTACSGDDNENNCDGVVCDRGICELSSGACVNAPNCGGSDDACLPGFSCSDSNVCMAEFPCDTNGNCENGVCNGAGVCVNPDTCNSNSACLPGFFCGDDSTCTEDPCNDVTCDRGVCAVGIGMCVNSETCTSGTEEVACLEGNRCIEGECTDEQTFCDALDCTRGVCSFEDGACIDATDCGGDDMECLDGKYCADDNTCQQNVCDALMTNCPRGVCDPSSGTCVNADECDNSDECIDGNLCVGTTCVATEDACQVGGCPGNQDCNYDATDRTAECAESAAGCMNALDCLDDRVCDDGTCAAPTACTDDTLEPNNMAADATNYQMTAMNGVIMEASLCQNDIDLYTFTTTDDSDMVGTLSATATITAADVGNGTLTVELVNSSDQVVATGTNIENGVQTNTATAQFAIDVLTQGTYTVRVTSDDVSTAGIGYDLLVDVVDENVLAACQMTLTANTMTPQAGDTSMRTSTGAESCADTDGTLVEEIWTLDVPQNSFATIRATPQVGVDVGLSIRSTCGADDSQLDCSAENGASQFEELTLRLDAGTYFIVVEAENTGGAYLLSVDLAPIVCTLADNNCADADTANICNANGTAFDQEMCENGCDMVAGRCTRNPGDVCATAIQVDNTEGVNTTLVWADYSADYDPGPGSCVPDNSFTANDEDTDGPDAVFAVTVPDNSVLTAEIERGGSTQVALYFVTDCQDIAGSCVVGENNGTFTDEDIVYVNDTGADVSGYVVFDSDAASTFTNSPVSIAVQPIVCTPGDRRCVLNRESQLCNEQGTAFDSTTICDNGCDDTTGACVLPENDVCSSPIVITPGTPINGDTSIFNNNYASRDSGCGTSGGGNDAVFLLQNLQVGDFVELEMTSNFDAVLWVATDCDATNDEIDGCFGVADDPEELSFTVTTAGDVFVIADTFSSGSGPFTLTAAVTPAVCTPGELLGCADANNLEYCGDNGQPVQLPCVGGCANSACATPSADFCFDAVLLPTSPVVQTISGDSDDGTNSIELIGQVGECSFSTFSGTDENDSFYRINVPPNSVLKLDFDGDNPHQFYLMDETCTPNSCTGFDGDGDRIYELFTPVARSFTIVIDSDTTFGTTTWSLDYSVEPAPAGQICNAGERTCLGNVAQICSEDETSYDNFSCPGTCTDGFCDHDPVTTDNCTTAPDVTGGYTAVIDPDDHMDLFTGDPGPCGLDVQGNDAHFRVNLQDGEVLRVTADSRPSFRDPAVYIYTDCADAEASCLAGTDGSSFHQTVYQAVGAQTVFVGIDGESQFTDPAQVVIEVTPPDCVTGQTPTCNAEGDALLTCESGVFVEYPCGDTVNTCTNDACDQPTGHACFDTIALTRTVGMETMVSGSFDTGFPATFGVVDEELTGLCRVSGATTARDVVYSIDLLANDRITFEMDSGFTDTYILISPSCEDATQCQLNNLSADEFTLDYVASAAGTYYVIVRSEFSSSADFDITYTITENFAGSCTPNTFYCVDATSVARCDEDGNVATTATCPGGCIDGACAPTAPGNDMCAGAVVVESGAYFINRWEDGTDTSNLSTSSCLTDDSPGADFFYAIDLQPNEILTVTASAADDTDDPAIYISTDCDDLEGTCVAGSADGDRTQTTSYQASAAERVYVVADSESSFDTSWQSIYFEITVPNCDEATFVQQCNMDGTAFEYCVDGFIQEYDCAGVGTCDTMTGRCTEPVGEICFDPFNANPTTSPETFSGTLDGDDDDYSLLTGNACTGSITPAGDDAYYVDLTAGQTLTASVVSTESTPEDLAIYITSDCDTLPNSCLAGADTQGQVAMPEMVTYTATADETVFVIVDSFYVASDGAYDLTISVQ